MTVSSKTIAFSVVLGQVIHQLRTVKGISQTELADRLGLGQSVMSRIESGVTPLLVDMMSRIAQILDLRSPSELLARAEASAILLERQGVRVLYGRPAPSDMSAPAVSALMALAATADS